MDRKWIRFFSAVLLCALLLAGCAAEVDPAGTAEEIPELAALLAQATEYVPEME